MDRIDFGDRKTQIVIGAGVVVAGVLVVSSFRRPSSPAPEVPVRPVIQAGDAFGTRADAQGQQGVWGWVGNDSPGGGSGTIGTGTGSTGGKPEEPKTPTMGVEIVPNIVTVGKSFTVRVSGVAMNDPIEVYRENTTGRPLATGTGGYTGSVNISVKAADDMIGTSHIVVQNTINRAVASGTVTVRPAEKPAEPDKPTEPTKPTEPAKPSNDETAKVLIDVLGDILNKQPAKPAEPAKPSQPTTPPVTMAETTKYGRTKINPAGKPYTCPAYATMVQEPGSSNHVCERNDDGRLFPVEYARGGEEPEPRVFLGGISPMPERITPAELTIRSGESLREFAIRAYGSDDGLVKLGRLNDLSNVHAGDRMRLK